jgi:hypothetical protein
MPLYSGPGARIASGGKFLPVFYIRTAICPFSGSIRHPHHIHPDISKPAIQDNIKLMLT